MINTDKLKVSPITNYDLYNLLISSLGSGEASGIALAYENDGYFFASEDETARLEAIDILKSSDLVLGLNELLDFAIKKKLVTKKEVDNFCEDLELFN